MRRRWALVMVAILTLTVAGCTGVPTSSGPQVVRTVGLGEPSQPAVESPPAGASPELIVKAFLAAMATSPDRLETAKAYMDPDAANKWTGATVTIVRPRPFVIGTFAPERDTVPVTYQPVGTLSAQGIYTPNVSQTTPDRQTTYSLAKNSDGQWRISAPVPPGLIITDVAFQRLFSQKALYFFDASGTHLVPDLRDTPLTDDTSVESFLLNQLVAGPRPELEDAVSPFVPIPNGNQRPSVTKGSPVVVQLPGAAALDGQAIRRLAAQLAFTMQSSLFSRELRIVDGNQTVDVPGIGDTFDSGDFVDLAPDVSSDTATITYVRDGAVVDGNGNAVAGKLGAGDYDLDTAVFDDSGGRSRVAGTTTDANGRRRLLVGDTTALTDVGLAGPLSAPAWAPVGTESDTDEVWVASGAVIYRYTPDIRGARPTVVQPSATSNAVSGVITRVSFSPEGTRLALVIAAPDGGSQVWVGAVIRTGPDVSLGSLQQVTPTGIDIADVGWRSGTSVAAIGVSTSFPTGVYLEVQVDGSRLLQASPDGLPDRPTTLAVTPSPQQPQQWATVGTGSNTSVWTRPTPGSTWTAPEGGATVPGSAPSFST